jgi:anti-anti-sigma factor
MSSVRVNVEKETVTIKIQGRFDFNLVQAFRDSYMNEENRAKHYVVDLSEVGYIDSSALGMMLNMKKFLEASNGAIRIANCQPNLKKIFTIAHFDRMFKLD